MFQLLKPPKQSTLPFLTLSSFLFWFLVSRVFVFYFPNFYLSIDDYHVHHFAYGILMLSILAYIFLVYPLSRKGKMRGAVWLGIALSLAYDEFAMWLSLEDIYYSRRSYDAIIVISLTLLNLIYFPGFWHRWGRRLGKLINILFLGIPKKIFSASKH